MSQIKVLGIIPARGGSKGIPKKNITPFMGRPLISHTIDAACNSGVIDDLVVSSDCNETLKLCESLNCKTIKRPDELSTDQSSMFPVIEHVISTMSDKSYDYIMLLQPTSPLRTGHHIKESLKLLSDEVNSVISVCAPELSPYKMYKQSHKGLLVPLMEESLLHKQRQELPQVLMPNGAIYIYKTSDLINDCALGLKKTAPYLMNRCDSVDIDYPEELELAEFYYKRR